MNRRELLAGAAGAVFAGTRIASLAGAVQRVPDPAGQLPPRRSGSARIAAIEIWSYDGRRETIVGATGQRQVNPLDVYDDSLPPLFHESTETSTRLDPINALYVKVRTDQGLEGMYGPIDAESAIIIHRQLRPFLTGKDALAGELIWDQMHRSYRHARRGNFMMAMSVTDNALWDLRGKYVRRPRLSPVGRTNARERRGVCELPGLRGRAGAGSPPLRRAARRRLPP